MKLNTHRWGPNGATAVICIHGVGQRGAVFDPLGKRLARCGHSVVAVDLRGHGASGHEPPWNVDTHVSDIEETIDALGVEQVSWVGHSFGGFVAAALAAKCRKRPQAVALLDPGLGISPQRALRSAEVERLDWSFASIDGAINALLSNEMIVVTPREAVTAYVKDDVCKGADGRFRFSVCPSAVVVAWSEMTLPPPEIARVPTLFLVARESHIDGRRQRRRYEAELGGLLTQVEVEHGHNVLWESPTETTDAVERFFERS